MVDPFTAEFPLCDDDGIVRGVGVPYSCTGHAHRGGEHVRCTSPAHAAPDIAYAPMLIVGDQVHIRPDMLRR